jgi:hypothetical protein
METLYYFPEVTLKGKVKFSLVEPGFPPQPQPASPTVDKEVTNHERDI